MTALARTIAVAACCSFAAAAAIGALSDPPPAADVPAPWPYREKIAMVQRNVLVRVEGRLDHMAVDPISRHLYVAAIRNNSLEVHHLPDTTTSQSIGDLSEPSDVVFIPGMRRLVVACAGDRTVRVFKADDAGRLTPERTVTFPDPTDSVAYDAATERLYATHGSSLGSFDIHTGERGRDAELGGRPESFVIEPGGVERRIFVNVPSKQAVVVVDLATHAAESEWPLASRTAVTGAADAAPAGGITEANYAIALDAPNHRLFVPTRVPARLIVINTDSGARVAEISDICKDADDCWYDPVTRRVLISGGGGAGAVTGVRQDAPDDYSIEFNVTTASGARTSVFSAEDRKLYVAAPAFGDDQAYIFVYLIGPR